MVGLPLLLAGQGLIAPRADAQGSTAQDNTDYRFQLCSRFPHNSQCQGYTAPIPLKDRAGLEGKCNWQAAGIAQGGECRVATYQEGLIVYLEQGERLSVLGDRRSTNEVKIPYAQMQGLTYREFMQSKDVQRALYGALFGAEAAQLAVKDKAMSEVAVQYQLTSSTGEAIAGASLNQISFISDRARGGSVRSQIESKTNLRMDVPVGTVPFVDAPNAR